MDHEIDLRAILAKAVEYRLVVLGVVCSSMLGAALLLVVVPAKTIYNTTVEIGRYVHPQGIEDFESPRDLAARIRSVYAPLAAGTFAVKAVTRGPIVAITSRAPKAQAEEVAAFHARIWALIAKRHADVSAALHRQGFSVVSKTRVLETRPVAGHMVLLLLSVSALSGLFLSVFVVLVLEAMKRDSHPARTSA